MVQNHAATVLNEISSDVVRYLVKQNTSSLHIFLTNTLFHDEMFQ